MDIVSLANSDQRVGADFGNLAVELPAQSCLVRDEFVGCSSGFEHDRLAACSCGHLAEPWGLVDLVATGLLVWAAFLGVDLGDSIVLILVVLGAVPIGLGCPVKIGKPEDFLKVLPALADTDLIQFETRCGNQDVETGTLECYWCR